MELGHSRRQLPQLLPITAKGELRQLPTALAYRAEVSPRAQGCCWQWESAEGVISLLVLSLTLYLS